MQIDRNVTGANRLAASFRDRLAAAREKINAASDSMTAAMDNLERTVSQADALVSDIEREATESQQSLAAFTNGASDA